MRHFIRILVLGFSYATITAPGFSQVPEPPVEAKSNPFGVAPSGTSAKSHYQAWMPKMAAIGVTSARAFPAWNALEPTKGTWNWEVADTRIAFAQENKIHIGGTLMFCANWAKPAGAKNFPFPRDNMEDWTNYVTAVVGRYKDRIHHWEVWNEPNGAFKGNFPDGRYDTTTDYAALVASTYATVKKVDPTAKIGATTASFDPAYIDQVLIAQAKMGKPKSLDYVCIHPYEIVGGFIDPNGEVPFLWMTRMMREMLKTHSPDYANAEVWMTEIGHRIHTKNGRTTTPEDIAICLPKIYALGIAQGIEHISWFEAQDPGGEDSGFGLIDISGTPRPAYNTYKTMTSCLGPNPKYAGWLALGAGGKGYGFVFKGPYLPVLIAWLTEGAPEESMTFTGDVKYITALGNAEVSLKAGEPLKLSETPVFVVGVPPDLLAQAEGHLTEPFPWGGNYEKATSVSIQLGAADGEKGVTQTHRRTTIPYSAPDGSTGVQINAPGKQNANGVYFYTHPSFGSVKTNEYYIRATAKRGEAKGQASLQLAYEHADSKGKSAYGKASNAFALTPGAEWQTYTWHLTDASFSKMWNYDFCLTGGGPLIIGKVEVSTVPFAK